MTPEICPWLGTMEDRDVRHAFAEETHLCYARKRPAAVDVEHQAAYCLADEHRGCPHYRQPPARTAPAPLAPLDEEEALGPAPRRFSLLRILLWILAIVAVGAVIYYYGSGLLQPLVAPTPTTDVVAAPSPSPSHTPSPAPTPLPPSPVFDFTDPTPTQTPVAGGSIHSLSPAEGSAGWVASDEERGNHLGDSYLYTGVFDGIVYHGVMQFDLLGITRGAAIHSATLDLWGLDGRRVGATGVWEVRVLARDIDADWARISYQDVHNAAVHWTLSPALGPDDLQPGGANTFALSSDQIRDLEDRLLEEHYTVSIRLDGPLAGEDSVYAWDSGYSAASEGNRPRLLLNVGPPPLTPAPSGTPPFVVVTSTPTPASVLTAAVWARTATAIATSVGQPTPTDVYEWTATPTIIVTNTPTPGSQATKEYREAVATAIAFTTGTYTPMPEHAQTATATPLWIPMEDLTPTPTPLPPLPTWTVPQEMEGLILFQSDRSGSARPWAMNAGGHDVTLLTSAWPYEVAKSAEHLSPDGAQAVYVGTEGDLPALFTRPVEQEVGRPILVLEEGRISSPVWSPQWDPIAFVRTITQTQAIWIVNRDGSGLRQLTQDAVSAAADPTFSPDGSRLAYTKIDVLGNRQVWTIGRNGAGAANISNNEYDEWGPVWIK